MDLEVLTIWPQQHSSSPQTSEQPAVTTLGVQVEFVRVTWLPDPLRLLHPDANTHRSPLCNAMITYFRAHITECPACGCAHLSAISWLLVWKTRHKETPHQSFLTTHEQLDALPKPLIFVDSGNGSHHQLSVGSVRQHVHQPGTCLRQTLQSLAPVGSVGQEALLHPLLLSVHLLQETLFLLFQGFARCADLSEDLLPLPVRRNLDPKGSILQEIVTVSPLFHVSNTPTTTVITLGGHGRVNPRFGALMRARD